MQIASEKKDRGSQCEY